MIGDARNDENLVVAQFHLSFLRFHNRVIDFLEAKPTGWLADFASAQMLTRLHYQWLIVEGYLKQVCDPAVVDRVVQDRASHFFKFRAEFDARKPGNTARQCLAARILRCRLPLRAFDGPRQVYDYNKNIRAARLGVPNICLLQVSTSCSGSPAAVAISTRRTNDRLPKNWIIDWTRFVRDGAADH